MQPWKFHFFVNTHSENFIGVILAAVLQQSEKSLVFG